MKTLLIALLFFNFLVAVAAQSTIQWQKTFGGSSVENARAVLQTAEGGFIVAGYAASSDGNVIGNHGGTDAWVVKLDNTGFVQWAKSYGGSENERAYDIQQTKDSGFIVAGFTASNDGDVSGNHGDKDIWVLKLDSEGIIQWQKTLGGSFWEEAWSVKQTKDGGFIIAGRANSIDGDVTGNHGSLDYWVVKLSSAGALEWQRSLGGSGLDLGYAVSQTDDGGYIVVGESNSQDGDINTPYGSSDYWVAKLNFEGKIEWEKTLGGTNDDRGNDIQQTRDGGFIVFGQSSSVNGDITGNHGGYDCWAVKLSANGTLEWQKALGGSNEEFGQSIEQVSDGGYILAGITFSTDGDVSVNNGGVDLWIVKLTEDGILEWQKPLGGSNTEQGFSNKQTLDGGFIVAGEAWSNDGDVSGVQGKSDFWIVKLAPESSSTTTAETPALEIYPNPATHGISLLLPQDHSAETGETLTVCITNLLGQELHRQRLSTGEALNIASLPNGLYHLTATTSSGKVFSGKFTKLE